jgi:transposase
MVRLGMRVSDSTILRQVKHLARTKPNRPMIRVAGVDEWAWRKGAKFGTIVVDLERRRVVDLLANRAADRMAGWFKEHPEVEIINRDRAGATAYRQSRSIFRHRGAGTAETPAPRRPPGPVR